MHDDTTPIILIPARMASTRLPGKPMADIAGQPMIAHVFERAREAGVGRVAVATSEVEIFNAIEGLGGEAVMTDAAHASGSDRIFEALQVLDPAGVHRVVVNVQGDLPTLNPVLIRHVVECLTATGADIATLAAPLADEGEWLSPDVVKVIADFSGGPNVIAEDFRRTPDARDRARARHHIGIYAYSRDALERFVGLPQGVREQAEKLEQLRALEAGMTIAVRSVDTIPLGVDTAEHLEQARKVLASGG